MDEYISSVELDVDGKRIDDWKKVGIKEIELRKEIRLARKSGFVRVINPSYGLTLDYVVPMDKPAFEFEEVENATLTLTYDNGLTETYTGVCALKVGEQTLDGDNELVRTIEFGASGRIKA